MIIKHLAWCRSLSLPHSSACASILHLLSDLCKRLQLTSCLSNQNQCIFKLSRVWTSPLFLVVHEAYIFVLLVIYASLSQKSHGCSGLASMNIHLTPCNDVQLPVKGFTCCCLPVSLALCPFIYLHYT